MKKKILIIALLLCLLAAVGGTYAYYTTNTVTHNVITSGKVDVELVEQQSVGGELVPYPDEPIQIIPGISVSKVVSVKSLEQPAWIRMSYTVSVLDADKKPKDIPAEELAAVVSVNTDTSSWQYKDGWYYYKAPLGAGGISKPLFTTVSFSGPNMGNEYQNCTLNIDVKTEAIQQANNGATYTEAYWPA